MDRSTDPDTQEIWTRLSELVAPALATPEARVADGEQSLSTQASEGQDIADRIGELQLMEAPSGRLLSLWKPPLPFAAPRTGRGGGLAAFFQHDTLAIDLTLKTRFPGDDSDLRRLSDLNPDGTLLPGVMQPTLGQSLLLVVKADSDSSTAGGSGEAPANEHAADCAELATKCARHLISSDEVRHGIPEPRSTGHLHGGPLFEYDIPLVERPALHLPASLHLLVWVHTAEETTAAEAAGDYYFPLLRLLVSRAKIQYSYQQARGIFEKKGRRTWTTLKTRYDRLGHLPEADNERLAALEQHLNALPAEISAQAHCLQKIQVQKTTLQTNLYNFQSAADELQTVAARASHIHPELASDVSGLASFAEEEAQQRMQQIETDLQYLRPGEALASHVLGSVQAQTDLLARRQQQRSQAEERKVELRIKWIAAAIGAVLTVGTITATVGDEMVSSLIHAAGPVTPPDGAVEIVGRVAMETLVQLILGFSIAVALAAPIAVLGGLYWLGRYIYRESAPSRWAAKSGEEPE